MPSTARLIRNLPSFPLLAGMATASAGVYYCYPRLMSTSRAAQDSHTSKFPIASTSEMRTGSPWSFPFATLILEETTQVNHNVKHLKFRLPEGYSDASIGPITSLLTIHKPKDAWLPVLRPYTPIDAAEPGFVSFLVKLYPNGKGSGHLHSLSPGDSLSVRPIHEFDYKPNSHSHVVLIAGGAGITPFIQIIRHIMNNPEDKTSISLVYANNTMEDILLKAEFDKLQEEKRDKFRVQYLVSELVSEGQVGAAVIKGRIDRGTVQAAMPEKKDWNSTKVLVCGPEGMVKAVAGSSSGILKELGVKDGQIKKF